MGILTKEQLNKYLGEEKAKNYYKDLEKYNGKYGAWSINWKGIFCTPIFAMKYGVVFPIYTHSYIFNLVAIVFYYLSVYTEELGAYILLGGIIFLILIIVGSTQVFFQSIELLMYKYGHNTVSKVTKKQLWGWSLFYYFPLIILIIVESNISFDFNFKSFDQTSHDRFEKALKELKRPNPLQVLATGYKKVPLEKVEKVSKIDSFLNIFSEDIEHLPYDYILKKGLAHPFIRDDKKQIVIDKTLGLTWQDDKSVEKPYAYLKDANKSCEELVLGEYNDWHLPTAYELLSIAYSNSYNDYKRNIGRKNYSFKNGFTNAFWSITSSKYNKDFIIISSFGEIYPF